jgi:regulator of protease activity HflC (stomatin/prohibitin superfamily)
VKAMRAMELQMIAERRRRQKVIRSEGESRIIFAFGGALQPGVWPQC